MYETLPYFLYSTSVLSFHIDVVFTIYIGKFPDGNLLGVYLLCIRLWVSKWRGDEYTAYLLFFLSTTYYWITLTQTTIDQVFLNN